MVDDAGKTKDTEAERRADAVIWPLVFVAAMIRGAVVAALALSCGLLAAWAAVDAHRVHAFVLGSVLGGFAFLNQCRLEEDDNFRLRLAGLLLGVLVGLGKLLPVAQRYLF
ncbi:hypothetical protein G7K71_02780 [Desulfofundulus sp. TPOSR]|uniref:hypothetical protein n=1 Tax=Desulfofundulus sp. TPOSR TaxID=2714340 RepID=UPI001407EE0B|nr:hypothetical protein [Desulfofundulus sp. TPOSR]NHM25951.1 hypothetical protein [Desulfofundulus sp. TPOSR]